LIYIVLISPFVALWFQHQIYTYIWPFPVIKPKNAFWIIFTRQYCYFFLKKLNLWRDSNPDLLFTRQTIAPRLQRAVLRSSSSWELASCKLDRDKFIYFKYEFAKFPTWTWFKNRPPGHRKSVFPLSSLKGNESNLSQGNVTSQRGTVVLFTQQWEWALFCGNFFH
jgi:hypothetical protein